MSRRPGSVALNLSNFDAELYERLRRHAFETRQPYRAIVEAALREYFERHPWNATEDAHVPESPMNGGR